MTIRQNIDQRPFGREERQQRFSDPFRVEKVVFIDFQWYSGIFRIVKRCSVIFTNDQRFSVLIIAVSALKIAEFLLCNNTDHGCSSSETVIFIEIHALCINYHFWNILKSLFASLNQFGVSMIIIEIGKDVNPGS